MALNKLSFVPANRRGSPSRIEGLGSSINGVKGKSSPCRFGRSPRFGSACRTAPQGTPLR
ncbi:hypothetical protein COI95_23685 [Bacillus cereus]|nr:hypothetical protein COI95_23685 [Bacillus cereus]